MPYFPDNGKIISIRYGLVSEYEAGVKAGYKLRPAEMGICFTPDNKLDSIYVGNTKDSSVDATKTYPAPVTGRYMTQLLAKINGEYVVSSNTDLVLGKLTNQVLLTDKPSGLQYGKFQCTNSSPTTKDCLALGYTAGSLWINSANNRVYVCTYSTERAAYWANITESLKTTKSLNVASYFNTSASSIIVPPSTQIKLTGASTVNITLASPFTSMKSEYSIIYTGAWSSLIWNTNIMWVNEPSTEGTYNISILYGNNMYLGSVQKYQ